MRSERCGASEAILAGAALVLVACGAGERQSSPEVGPRGAASAPASAPASVPASPEAKVYTNPVLDADFADPALLREPDGWIYAYATQTASDSGRVNVQVSRSRDLVHWEPPVEALPVKPAWASTSEAFWSPHVLRDGDRYYLYYATDPDTKPGAKAGKCLAVATGRSPLGPFEDSGAPMRCGADSIHIDPMPFDDPKTGKRLLYWGSGGQPIRVQELAPDRLRFAEGSQPVDLVVANDKFKYERLVEGVWVTLRDGRYYLFYSGDYCCDRGERRANYAVLVARSDSATGPFESLAAATGRADSAILVRNARWNGPGHNALITDDAGQDWLVYHAIDTRNAAPVATGWSRRPMLIDRLVWKDGWPAVEGGTPSTTPKAAPVFR